MMAKPEEHKSLRHRLSPRWAAFFFWSFAVGHTPKKEVKNEARGDGLFGRPYRWHHWSGSHRHLVPIPGHSQWATFLRAYCPGNRALPRARSSFLDRGSAV